MKNWKFRKNFEIMKRINWIFQSKNTWKLLSVFNITMNATEDRLNKLKLSSKENTRNEVQWEIKLWKTHKRMWYTIKVILLLHELKFLGKKKDKAQSRSSRWADNNGWGFSKTYNRYQIPDLRSSVNFKLEKNK